MLSYSIEERLAPFLAYLGNEIGLSEGDLTNLIQQRPVLLGLKRENVEQLVGYLVENGSSREEIVHLLQTSL